MAAQTTQAPIIVTDSTCDLPAAALKQYGIHVVPMNVHFGDETYRCDGEMTLDQFFARLEQGDQHPTTSPPSQELFAALYRDLGAENRPILSIHVSARLSETAAVARQVAEASPGLAVTVVDSRTISGALGLQVLAAARAAAAGRAVEQILPLLDQTFAAGNLMFVVDDLSYLHRGGRIGAIPFYVAQMLTVKPIAAISKEGETAGQFVPIGRARSLERAVGCFVSELEKEIGVGGALRAIVSYASADDGPTMPLVQRLKEKLEQRFECALLEVMPVTPVLGVHTGQHAFALGYAAGDWAV